MSQAGRLGTGLTCSVFTGSVLVVVDCTVVGGNFSELDTAGGVAVWESDFCAGVV